MEFVKNFTPSISPNFNSFTKKKHKKWVKMEKFTPMAKILHCRQHWRHGQIPPLHKASDFCWQTILYFLEHLRMSHTFFYTWLTGLQTCYCVRYYGDVVTGYDNGIDDLFCTPYSKRRWRWHYELDCTQVWFVSARSTVWDFQSIASNNFPDTLVMKMAINDKIFDEICDEP